MSRAIRANYSQQHLFPARLEDWVGEDHPARFIREFVDSLDLGELGFRQSSEEQGRPHYGSDLLLKAWIYGYLNKIRSSRELEKASREHLSLIWLLGGWEPDHNTLWRFWREHRQGLRKLFGRVVRIAHATGVVGLLLHALDGTRIEAVDSTDKACRERRLKEQLKRLESSIQELEEAIEQAECEEEGSYRLPEDLRDQKRLRERIEEELAKEEQKAESREARIQRMGDGRKRLGFNAQTVVDGSSGLIVAEEVAADETDYEQLIPLLEQTEENLGGVAEDTVADRGYRSARVMARAEEKDYSVLVRLHDKETRAGPYHWTRFEHDPQRDVCVCPRGEVLPREGGYRDQKRGVQVRTYRCQVWQDCPVAGQCSRDPKGRKVKLTDLSPAVLAQRERQMRPQNQVKLSMRKAIVERSYAEIKQHMGFRRWTYRGLRGVRTQWAMICTAYNLKRLMALWKRGEIVWSPV